MQMISEYLVSVSLDRRAMKCLPSIFGTIPHSINVCVGHKFRSSKMFDIFNSSLSRWTNRNFNFVNETQSFTPFDNISYEFLHIIDLKERILSFQQKNFHQSIFEVFLSVQLLSADDGIWTSLKFNHFFYRIGYIFMIDYHWQ